jgi:hypothetical protein
MKMPNAAAKIKITVEMLEELNSEIERTGVNISKITELENCPEGIGNHSVQYWKSLMPIVDEDHWKWLIKTLNDLPDTNRIAITKEMRQFLVSEM